MNKVIGIIIEFIKAIQDKGSIEKSIKYVDEEDREFEIIDCKYLLGQILRQYTIPRENWHISKEAKELWEKITDESVEYYRCRETVTMTKEGKVHIRKYVGSSTYAKEEDIIAGNRFIYRDVFHNEHMICISDVIDRLIKLDEVNEENVIAVLNQIHIYRILKEEEQKLKPKFHRQGNYEDIVRDVYLKNGVIVLPGPAFTRRK